ncbi:MAG: TIR domain-containing protein [Agriterribacter sp.]
MYNAFISYSHGSDLLFAPALQSALQNFAKPWYKKRNLEIFRDESNLSASPLLWKNITAALDAAQFLILLASPASEKSLWVNKEVEYWLQHKTVDTILIVLTEGNMDWDNEHNGFLHPDQNALPPVLDGAFDSAPFYIDMRHAKTEKDLSADNPIFKKEILKLAARLHGLQPNDMASEEVTAHRKMIRIRNAAFIVLTLLLIAALVGGYLANQEKNKASQLAGTNTKLAKAFESVYFYADRFALSNGLMGYFFSDKNGDRVEKLGEWAEAEQFNYTGYARVRKLNGRLATAADKEDVFVTNLADYIVDTTGTFYPSAYHPKDMDSNTLALDLSDQHLGVLTPSVFSNPRLEILLMPNNKLTALPKDIAKLTHLKKLDLSENKLPELPEALGTLPALEILDLRGNDLTSLPKDIGQLQHLKELHVFVTVNGAYLSGIRHNIDFSPQYLTVVPKEIGLLQHLTSLDLPISAHAVLPPEIGKLKQLQQLILYADSAATMPKEVWELKNLTWLILHEIEMDSLPAAIKQLQYLKHLQIAAANLRFLPKEIGRLSQLFSLSLNDNHLTTIPEQLGALTNLSMLDLSQNQLTELPAIIGELKKLSFLTLNNNHLTSLPEVIGKLSSIISLSLDNNKFLVLPKAIGKLDSLRTLSLNGNNLETLPDEIGNLQMLNMLSVNQNHLTSVSSSISRLKNLKTLDLSNNKLLSLPQELGKLNNLKELVLFGNPLPPQVITSIQQLLPNCKIIY